MAYGLKGSRSFAKLNAMKQATTLTKDTTSFASDRAAYNKVIVNYAGNVTISGGGYTTAMRGEVNVAAGSTLKDGFFYGAQGKVICPGAVAQTSSLRLAGVCAQLDCGGSTLTDGQVQALWADVSGSDPTSTWGDGDRVDANVIRASNSTGKPVNSHMLTTGKANYIFDVTCDTAGVIAAAGANQAGKSDGSAPADRVIKISLNGVDGYIPVFNANN